MPLYSLLLLSVLVAGSPFWVFRMVTSGRYRRGLSERLGFVRAGLSAKVNGRPVIWLHAVSVGEVLAASALITGLQERLPGFAIALSTTTEAGQTLARQRFPELAVFYLPLDFAVIVRRYLRLLRPRLLILMESELWPNLLRESRRSGAVIAVVNARISDRSFPRYMRLRRLWRPILRHVSLFLAQGEETAERLRAIGVPGEKVLVSGNLKYDVKPAAQGELYQTLRNALWDTLGGAPLLVAGSTLEGEEALLLEAWETLRRELPRAVLLLAPRHTPRFAAVGTMIEARGFHLYRASTISASPAIGGGEVILLDTIGDLAGIYELATAAFLGGSLLPAGGHNPLEAARFGVPVIMGPSFANFREVVAALRANSAIRVLAPGEDLSAALLDLLGGSAEAIALGERGRAVFRSQTGAAERCVIALVALLPAAEAAQ